MTMLCGAAPRIFLMALVTATLLRAEGIAQTCNPAIDGTYCAEQMSKKPGGAMTTSKPNPSLSGDFFSIVRENDPATFGAITFSGGSRCIGLLRRSNCN
jgi:hypothetical protein